MANRIATIALHGDNIGTRVTAAFGMVVQAVAKAADWLKLLEGSWRVLRAVAELSLGAILIPLALIIKAVDYLGRKLGLTGEGFQEFTKGLETFQEETMKSAREQFRQAGENFSDFWNETNCHDTAMTPGLSRGDA